MKYYTKEWYNSSGTRFYTSGLKTIPDKVYSDKEIKHFYEEALQEEIECERKLYDTPPSFYYDEETLTPEAFNPEHYLIVNKEIGEVHHPQTFEELKLTLEKERKEAEERFLNRLPFDETETRKWFQVSYRGGVHHGASYYPEWICKEVDMRLLALHLIPESAYKRLKEEEDADVLELKKVRSDVELYLNRDGLQLEGESPYTKVTFKNVSMLDREKGLVFRKKTRNDGTTGSSC